MLINLRNALMAGKRLPYDAEVEYLRVDAVGPCIVIDGVTYCDAVGTYYAFKISSGGVVTHDLIPVRRGNVGYMYDRTTNKLFGNSGTGDFVLGPDVVPVEYIESTGTQWIDTGVLATYSDTVLDITIARSSTASNHVPVGARNAVYLLWINAQNVMLNYAGGNGASTSPTTIGDGFVRIVSTISKNSGSSIEVGGMTYTSSRTMLDTTSAYQYALFAAAATGESVNQNYFRSPAGERIAKAKISKDGVIVRDYKAIRVGSGSTWEGAMMDVLTRRIYRNAGTGAFGYGNNLKYPIPA